MKSAIKRAGAIERAQRRQGDHCRLGNAADPKYCSDEELFRSWILRNLKADVQVLRPLANCTSLLQTESLWIDCWSPKVLEKWIEITHNMMCGNLISMRCQANPSVTSGVTGGMRPIMGPPQVGHQIIIFEWFFEEFCRCLVQL